MDMDPASSTPLTVEVLPTKEDIEHARSQLISFLPEKGIGLEQIEKHMRNDLVPGFNKPNKSPNFYGFVTGGTTPASLLGDHIAVESDQNVQVFLPKETIAIEVEDRALNMVCDLLNLSSDEWSHRTFTTGATASNIAGLACGREFVLKANVAELGMYEAMRTTGIERIQVLTTVPHSSLRKAASVVGLGRACVRDVGLAEAPHRFDMEALRSALSNSKAASIVAISCAEVNTGLFATNGEEMKQIRQLCDQYGAWMHVDAAFGLLARALPHTKEYAALVEGVEGLELADSITGDAHKLLNVPYDCGIFLSRHLALGTNVFQNTKAAYLSVAAGADELQRIVPSPLNIGLENSRRFRALPVYATLAAYGREGYRDMMERQIGLARAIANLIASSPYYELLPDDHYIGRTYIIVLFRAKDDEANKVLVERINNMRRVYVSGTQWDGRPAARFAIATWQVQIERDLAVIKEVLQEVVKPQ
ncbi:hypothetical protein LTR37_003593 [Vermiconidia calcicola]|uniref:Uncharacterized protein n=1 Tax=Vermiconidia calcicola TaxID=1690605 RepID=A0ACC3NPI9_9PEZI|nr:hypothetical protein LTR37_003593 [Vermiconidia calcicola]